MHLIGNVFDGKPMVGEQEPGAIKPHLLNMVMNGPALRIME